MKSSSRAAKSSLLQGTLDMLILRTLEYGPAHGHDISRHIRQTTQDVLQVEHGSLYPALHRLEAKGWIAARWERRAERNREFKYYRLTPAGKRHLAAERSRWRTLVDAISSVMKPVEEP
jgi:PadR family transcriptional regulator, regulatory protein PadR